MNRATVAHAAASLPGISPNGGGGWGVRGGAGISRSQESTASEDFIIRSTNHYLPSVYYG